VAASAPHRDDRSAFDAFEAEGWEAAAAAYQPFFGPITARLIEPILDATGAGPGTRLLDLACGHGELAARAAASGAQPVGVDVAEAMLREARRAHPRLDFRRGEARALPCEDASFDVAAGNFVILHLGEPERAVAELARVLVSGGRVAITVWDTPERSRIFGWVYDAMAAAGAEPPADIPEGPPFFRFADDDAMRALLEDNGFVNAAVQTIAFTHIASSADDVWAGMVDGTVRTGAMVGRQPPEVRRAIRTAFDEVVARESPGPRVEIPFAVKLGTATRHLRCRPHRDPDALCPRRLHVRASGRARYAR
jgi:SAM-dependent methyltransferase